MLATPLTVAFDTASGRRAAASSTEAAALVSFAQHVLSTRRRSQALEACPAAIHHRIRHLLAERSPGSRLAQLVFDSFAGVPAVRSLRGSPRLLRYEVSAGRLDIRVKAIGSRDVQVFLSVSDTSVPATFVRALGGSNSIDVPLDSFGVGSLERTDRGELVLHVYDATGDELFHTPPIDME